jgi:hypothetical protein
MLEPNGLSNPLDVSWEQTHSLAVQARQYDDRAEAFAGLKVEGDNFILSDTIEAAVRRKALASGNRFERWEQEPERDVRQPNHIRESSSRHLRHRTGAHY